MIYLLTLYRNLYCSSMDVNVDQSVSPSALSWNLEHIRGPRRKNPNPDSPAGDTY